MGVVTLLLADLDALEVGHTGKESIVRWPWDLDCASDPKLAFVDGRIAVVRQLVGKNKCSRSVTIDDQTSATADVEIARYCSMQAMI
jgi:hypothetical protein